MTAAHKALLIPMFKLRKSKMQLAEVTGQLEKAQAELAELRGSGVENSVSISSVDQLSELFGLMPGGPAGVSVTPGTSMKVSIVYACVRLISGAIAQMPVHTYDDSGGVRERVVDAVSPLLNMQPTPIFSAATFWEFITASMLLHGDGFAIIYRNRAGEPQEILPVSPANVDVKENSGRLIYIMNLGGKPYAFDQDDVLHFPGFGFNGLRSMSVIRWGAYNAIGVELAMEEFSADFFKSGAHQSVALIKQGKWDSDQKAALRESWVATYGGLKNKKYPLVFDSTTDIKQLNISAKDSQLLESREFQITDIARAFGLPSFMVNQEQKSTSWGSGITEIALSFLRFTLMPHVNRFEQELNRKFYMRSKNFCEFNAAGLMRGTQKERYDAYMQGLGGAQGPGFLKPNEVRRFENLPPDSDPLSDRLYHPQANQPATNGEN